MILSFEKERELDKRKRKKERNEKRNDHLRNINFIIIIKIPKTFKSISHKT